MNTKVLRPVRGINPHRKKIKYGFSEYGPSDLFSGTFDEPARQLQPGAFATFVGTKVEKLDQRLEA
ncbi:MAG: hypothetical protein ACMZ7B_08940 [Balneola sp.]